MESSIETDNLISKLIPVLSETERKDMIAYYEAYEKHEAEISKIALEDLKSHPVFGKLISEIPPEVSEAQNKKTRALQKDAILNDNWYPYITYQMQMGSMYAKMGYEFSVWYELIALAKKYLIPVLRKEYETSPKLFSALNGMGHFFDIGMGILGEAYMQTKEEIIQADRQKIKKLNDELEQKVLERTSELQAINKELDAFSYSVSHDLRAPLRAVNGYAEILQEDFSPNLDDEGRRIVLAIQYNATKMGRLIDDLLTFSRLGRKELNKVDVDMKDLTEAVIRDLAKSVTHQARIEMSNLHQVEADYGLLYQVMYNLVSNAVKYSSKKEEPLVTISSEEKNKEIIYTVRDNGAGFNMQYADKLFGVFQRLHSQEEFEGTGVGLAIVQRIIAKHDGRIWAEGKVGEGAAFHFALTK
jgi:signal transduction histidine kinase